MNEDMRIWLCGELRVEVHGERVESRLARRNSRELLALLSVDPAGATRERVIETLWPEEPHAGLDDLGLGALEALAQACLAEPGCERAAEGAARRLVWRAPFRERSHGLLMEALLAADNGAEALRVFDALRVLLRDELGASPGRALRALHCQVLQAGGEPSDRKRALVLAGAAR